MAWFIVYVVGSLLLLVFLSWLLGTVYIYLLHKRYAHLPSPKMPSFYLGHTPAMLAKVQQDGRFGELILKWSEECGHSALYVIFLVHHPTVICLNPEDIKEILMSSTKVEKSKFMYHTLANPFGERFLGQGLESVTDHELWKVRRRLYDPSFTRNSLHGLLPVFFECAEKVVDRLSTLADGKTQVLMREEFVAYGHAVIGKVIYSSDTLDKKYTDESLGLKHVNGDGTLQFLFKHSMNALTNSFENPFYQYMHPYQAEGQRETIRAVRKVGRDLIKKRIRAVENGDSVPNDILTQILRITSIEKNVDVEDLVDDFVTFYVGGYESTSNVLIFTLILLLQHPHIMQRASDEIFEVVGDKKSLTIEDLDQMKYLEQVFQETLRLYPPALYVIRDATEQLTLSGYDISKGTSLFISFYANHHNPEYWEDPEKFDPDRFDPGRPKASPFSYHPFSTGLHSCIGKTFAMLEMKTVMSRLLTNFKFHLPDGYQLRVEARIVFAPADGVPCTVEPL